MSELKWLSDDWFPFREPGTVAITEVADDGATFLDKITGTPAPVAAEIETPTFVDRVLGQLRAKRTGSSPDVLAAAKAHDRKLFKARIIEEN